MKHPVIKDLYIFNIQEDTGEKETFEIFWNQTRILVLKSVSQFIITAFNNNCLEPKITKSGDPL